jgi:hypothetical protein
MTRRLLATALLAVAVLSGCGPTHPYGNELTTREPTTAEIAGTYVLAKQSLKAYAPTLADDLTKLKAPPVITLSADGRYSLQRVPRFDDTATPALTGFSNESGTWKLTTVGVVAGGSSNKGSHWGLHFSGLPGSMAQSGFLGNPKPDGLLFSFGDPDSDEVMLFRKQ